MVATTDDNFKNAVASASYRFYSTVTVKFAENINDALDCLKRTNISLCFVDGDFRDSYGMLLARRIREIKRYKLIPIIYASHKMDDLITAFKTIHCYDYLIKPVVVEDIYFLIKLFSNEFIKADLYEDVKKPFVLLGVSQGMLKIYIDEILMVEARRRKCVIHTNVQEYEFAQTLNNFYEKVEQYGLLRAHRSYIINPMNVKKIDKISNVWIISFFESDKTSPLSKTFKNKVVEKLSFLL